jgi:hypothetical protein
MATALLSFGSAIRKYRRVDAPPGMGVAEISEAANVRWTSSSRGRKSTAPEGGSVRAEGRTTDTVLSIILFVRTAPHSQRKTVASRHGNRERLSLAASLMPS